MKHRFGVAPPGTLGIEEEVILVDAGTLETAPVFSPVVGPSHESFKPELFECFAELTTPVVPDVEAALVELRRLRGELAGLVESQGILVHAAGSHALARGAGQPIVPVERYERLAAALGRRIYRQLVCGLHVHVSVPDHETCLKAFEAVVPWLPTLLALSANSPFGEGKDTGRRSERAERLLEMPTGGTPPVLRSWDDWTAATQGDKTRRHWDAWPRPEYGTLEVRVMDMQTDVRRSAGLAAIVQALVAAGSAGPPPETYDRGLYARRRSQAAATAPDPPEVAALDATVAPWLSGGAWHLAELVLRGRPEAERQLEVAAADGIAAVPRDVVERTVAFG
jgi:glutamate---cysteine ligase / carboxylate-amine ligase